jgi:hypothetical protein
VQSHPLRLGRQYDSDVLLPFPFPRLFVPAVQRSVHPPQRLHPVPGPVCRVAFRATHSAALPSTALAGRDPSSSSCDRRTGCGGDEGEVCWEGRRRAGWRPPLWGPRQARLVPSDRAAGAVPPARAPGRAAAAAAVRSGEGRGRRGVGAGGRGGRPSAPLRHVPAGRGARGGAAGGASVGPVLRVRPLRRAPAACTLAADMPARPLSSALGRPGPAVRLDRPVGCDGDAVAPCRGHV